MADPNTILNTNNNSNNSMLDPTLTNWLDTDDPTVLINPFRQDEYSTFDDTATNATTAADQQAADAAAALAAQQAAEAKKAAEDAAAAKKLADEKLLKEAQDAAAALIAQQAAQQAEAIATAVANQMILVKQRENELLALGLQISKLDLQNPMQTIGRSIVNGLDYVSNKKNVHTRDDAGNIIVTKG